MNWWDAIQPDVRQRVEGKLLPITGRHDGHALSDLRCGGENGLITLFLGLFHWGCSGEELLDWHDSFEDFCACVYALSLI